MDCQLTKVQLTKTLNYAKSLHDRGYIVCLRYIFREVCNIDIKHVREDDITLMYRKCLRYILSNSKNCVYVKNKYGVVGQLALNITLEEFHKLQNI